MDQSFLKEQRGVAWVTESERTPVQKEKKALRKNYWHSVYVIQIIKDYTADDQDIRLLIGRQTVTDVWQTEKVKT